tara:strand:+ start:547 stop:795 length:249 start_codon:yes stop_codon:yes gene_type:complete
MSFSDAIPVNTMSRSENSFGSMMRKRRQSQPSRQQVNISPETSMRATAKAKLGSALMHKLAYDRSGKLGGESNLGVYLSAQA